jgi:putative NIF3 family GTP cyclohydrolase 1 type 2
LKSITTSDPQQRTLIKLAQNNIAVYSPHTALDAAPGGLGDWLADVVSASAHGIAATRTVLHRISAPLPQGFEGAGYGRLVAFERPVPARDLFFSFAEILELGDMMIAPPHGHSDYDKPISSVAVCPGSGWDVLKDCDADVLLTGEMSHHNALKATMLGKWVVTVFHSNSERLFLQQHLRPQLMRQLAKDGVDCVVQNSRADRDPFNIVNARSLKKVSSQ